MPDAVMWLWLWLLFVHMAIVTRRVRRGMVSSTTQHAVARLAHGPLRRISQATAEQLTAHGHGHVPGFR